MLWVPVAVYVMFGDSRGVMYIFSCLSVVLGVFSVFGEHYSYYIDRRARAGEVVEQKDRKKFIALLFIVGIMKDLACCWASLRVYGLLIVSGPESFVPIPPRLLCGISVP